MICSIVVFCPVSAPSICVSSLFLDCGFQAFVSPLLLIYVNYFITSIFLFTFYNKLFSSLILSRPLHFNLNLGPRTHVIAAVYSLSSGSGSG